MQQRFLRIIKDLIQEPRQFHFLVAVSGGVDSMALAALMLQSELSIVIAHCNFKLRAKESDADQELVRSYAANNGIPFFVKDFETKKYAENKGISTQMAARELRYDWFTDLMNTEGLDYLVVAHHANDNLETALFNVTKGTGIAGIRGIKPLNNRTLRPFLSFLKEEIVTFATENKIPWREDKSNESIDYHRNFIRHEVIPKLELINPSVLKTFTQTSNRLLGLERILDSKLEEFQNLHMQEGVFTLAFEVIKEGVSKDLLIEMLQRKGFERSSIVTFINQESDLPGAYILCNGFKLWRERTTWVLEEVIDNFEGSFFLANDNVTCRKGRFEINTIKRQNISLSEVLVKKESIFLNTDKWTFPLEVRTWKEGDRIQPFGMKGTKLVSDILIDQKVPAHLKQQQRILASNGEILAVLGLKTSEKLRFKGEITNAIEIKHRFK